MNLANKEQKKFSLRNDISEWAFSRLNNYFPFKTQYTTHKGATSKASRENVSHYPYIELNNPCHKAWIIIDVDCKEMTRKLININSYEETGIPLPNMVLRNPESKRCQIIYAIDPVGVHSNARWKPQELYKLVKSSLNYLIDGADHHFHSNISQNPLCDQWDLFQFHDFEQSLSELIEGIPQSSIDKAMPGIYSKTKEPELNVLDKGFRNVGIFNYLRFFAYKRIDTALETLDFEEWSELLLKRTKELNQNYCVRELPESEIILISRSVADGTWNKGFGQKRPGLMNLPEDMPIKKKQAIGARYAASKRKGTTIEKIRVALTEIIGKKKLTKSLVAEKSGISIRTIYRRWSEIKELLMGLTSDRREGEEFVQKSMTNSAPQVSALCLSLLFSNASYSARLHQPLPYPFEIKQGIKDHCSPYSSPLLNHETFPDCTPLSFYSLRSNRWPIPRSSSP